MKAIYVTLIVIICIVLFFVFFKLYLKWSTGWDRSPTCLIGKTAIVTGANSGIGFYTALDFAKRGARVILACRDPYRAEQAKMRIVESTGNQNVVVKIIDLASLASVRKFAVEIKAMEERLDILVNNAGAGGFEHTITQDGLSLSMEANHFSPFLLTILLIGMLKKSAPSRVVTVSSELARVAKLDPNNLNDYPGGILKRTFDYANTKLCNILFTNELARKLKGTGVDANSLHPGAVQTEFLKKLPGCSRRVLSVLAAFFYKTSEEGAQTSIYLSVAKELDGVTGEYFADCKKARMPKAARDQALAKKIWEKSEEFVKLSPEERQLL